MSNPKATNRRSGSRSNAKQPPHSRPPSIHSASGSRKSSPTHPTILKPPTNKTESETDEDWDLANATDTDDNNTPKPVSTLKPPLPKLVNTQNHTPNSCTPLSESSLNSLSALPLSEALQIVRTRTFTTTSGGVDVWQLYLASTELVNVVRNCDSSLQSRILAWFLLYALYFDPKLPIPQTPLSVFNAALTRKNSTTTLSSSMDHIFSQIPVPHSLPLLSSIPTATQKSNLQFDKLPIYIRSALLVSLAHPFLGVFLQTYVDPNTHSLELLLIKLLLVCPRPPPTKLIPCPFQLPHLLICDHTFLEKSAMEFVTNPNALNKYLALQSLFEIDAVSLMNALVKHNALVDQYFTTSLAPISNNHSSNVTNSPPTKTNLQSESITTKSNNSILPAKSKQINTPSSLKNDKSALTTNSSCDDEEEAYIPFDEEVRLHKVLTLASTSPLEPKSVALPSVIPARLVLDLGLFNGLITHSPKVAVEIIQRTRPLAKFLEDVVLHLPQGPLRVAHLTVIEELWQLGCLKRYLPIFVSRVLGHAMKSAMPRTVQITAKFLAKHVLDVPIESLFEMKHFCSEYLRFKDVSDLYKTVAEIIAASDHGENGLNQSS